LSELKYWLWLTLKKELSIRKITVLLDHFGTPEKVFYATAEILASVPGLTKVERKAAEDKNLQRVYRVIEVCKKKNIKILAFDSPYYPKLLASIYDPPYVLYARCRERIDLNTHATLAVVGTRRASSYGKTTATSLASALAESGMTVVSGMASGIDACAAEGALSAGGKTVAVLGCGVDICYPPSNKKLMQKIIDSGLVLSEYPPGTPPFPGNFPKRNRIISGLSLGTVVVEAPVRSGALITARNAGEQNREVFVVPADITRAKSRGSNGLLQEGAKPVLDFKDILCEFEDRYSEELKQNRPILQIVEPAPAKGQPMPVTIPLDDAERKVMSLLSDEPKHIDQLAHQGLSLAEVNATLTLLEMKGLVRQLPGKQYILTL